MNKQNWLIWGLVLFLGSPLFAQKVTTADLAQLLDKQWKGQLTYLDYTSKERTSIPVSLTVKKVGDTEYTLAYNYNDEPHANQEVKLALLEEGAYLNEEKVMGKKSNEEELIIVTESEGEDDNVKATFIKTYQINAQSFTVIKEVEMEGQERFERNRYEFKLKQ